MNEKLAEALGCVNGQYVAEAGRKKKRKKRIFLGLTAAVLALALILNPPMVPMVVTARAVAMAADSRAPQWNGNGKLGNSHDTYEEFDAARDVTNATAQAALLRMRDFLSSASDTFLSGSEGNTIWSPVNAAIALAVLAETADGTTRQEVLELLGVRDVQTLRRYISALWELSCHDERNEFTRIASSLWLDKGIKYDQSVMDTLAYDYYASVYQGNLGSAMTNNAIQTWVNNQTGGFLNRFSNGIDLTPSEKSVKTVMSLISTVYLKGKWQHEFNAELNTGGVFHSPGGDRNVTYMNAKKMQAYYYWAEDFGAVRLGMKNGVSMWLMLPDEDKTTADVLESGDYLGMLGSYYDYENSKYMMVNLSLPKFDISAELDLIEGLQTLGLQEVFDENGGDFGTTFDTNLPIFVDEVKQASRVSIDETGVTAASYIELGWGAGAAAPPEDEIDFVLDRPFVFAIATGEGIPLFVGVVNEP